MKKVCFIVSHLGSGSFELVGILNKNPRCSIQSSSAQYDSPQSLNWLFLNPHKCRDISAVYGDHLLYNMSFSCKNLYEICNFVYVIRSARASLNEILSNTNYSPESAVGYYRFRLRRIYEMAKKTPGAVLVTWDDLASGIAFDTIEEYLGLKQPLEGSFVSEYKNSINESFVNEAQDAYERYHYLLKSVKLRRPQ